MNDDDLTRLRDSKNFCVLPWCFLEIYTNGKVYPCCKMDQKEIGDTSQSTEELWNSPMLRSLRVKMLNDEYISICDEQCYKGRKPVKKYVLEPELFDLCKETIRNTKPDGSCDVNFIMWSVPESNKCNFKCLYCCDNKSNLWREDNKIITAYQSFDRLKQEYSKYINTVKYLYFCAGESTFQDSYYWMMDELIRLKRTEDVKLSFMTNLSTHVYKSRNVYELLNQFKNVKLIASLDAMGSRAEYIRHGTKWDIVERNREELFKYKNIDFIVQPTMTNMNMYHFPDFHTDWYNKGLLKRDAVRYNILTIPSKFSVEVIPTTLKSEIIKKYENYKNWIVSGHEPISNYTNREHPVEKVNKILNAMNSNQDENLINEFVQHINEVDNIRKNNNFWKVFDYEGSFFKCYLK